MPYCVENSNEMIIYIGSTLIVLLAHNIPCLDLTTGRCHITSQNHGFAVDERTLPKEFRPYFTNLNDGSNEGIIHINRPIFGLQFHPEAFGGPRDTAFLFSNFLESVKRYKESQKLFRPEKESRPSALLGDILGAQRIGVAPVRRRTGRSTANGSDAVGDIPQGSERSPAVAVSS